MTNDTLFWSILDQLAAGEIVIDRPKGSVHPRQADMIYPLDYGFLVGTTAGDGDGIDVWIGSLAGRDVTGIACTADAHKRDVEIKLLLGCTTEEMAAVQHFLDSHGLGCIVLSRPMR
ncbi:MAG TPA: inorganic pyrophosphatase [Anaerolineae bacterium]|nr:inorganic pyrophosphatase [Anaerolineae bacterium]